MSHLDEQSAFETNDAQNVADHQYSVQDYKGNTQLEQGTAETHEQASDAYMTGNNEDEFNQGING